jgi:CheY-like chemotaxis protein
VDDLLDVSRITQGKIRLIKEPVDLVRVVRQAVEIGSPLVTARQHRLAVDLPEGPVHVSGDEIRLTQVVANLLNNAAKYTDPGGDLSVSLARDGGEAVVRVRDSGIGIPPHMLAGVFELFTQVDDSLDRAQGGLGIGLTLVRRLVEMHGGAVTAASEGPGRGSEFAVRLPVLAKPPEATPGTNGRPPAPAAARRRALIVDDNRDAAESLAALIGLAGHEVRVAHDGPTALTVAEAFRPEVVLLDIGLPGMTGYDVARALRNRPPTAGAVLAALTGYGQDEDRRQSREAGIDVHLVKPPDPEAIRRLLATPSRTAHPVGAK